MFVVHPNTMKAMDQLTLERLNISSFQLMYRAGTALFDQILKTIKPHQHAKFLILCGPGNNGGDALVIAQKLHEIKQQVSVWMLFPNVNPTDETKAALKALDSNISVTQLNPSNTEEMYRLINATDYIVDGIFGIGKIRPVEGRLKTIIETINKSQATTISIDIPSGLSAANGLIKGAAIIADYTLIVQAYKIGNLLHQAKDCSKKNILVNVGIVTDIDQPKHELLTTNKNLKIPSRKHFSHKYNYGNTLVVGGHKTMPGAPQMAALAALRTGSGLASLAVRENERMYFLNTANEILVKSYDSNPTDLLGNYHSYVFGPGFGKEVGNKEVLIALLDDEVPLIIDGDGIALISEVNIPKNDKAIIITPHVGEFAKLIGKTTQDVLEDTTHLLIDFTKKYPIWVLLKGPTTIIAENGNLYFVEAGNPGLAKAGSGDVLSGVIATCVMKNLSTLNALELAVNIHGKAADLTEEQFGEEGYLASDVIQNLPKAVALYKPSK